MRLFIAIPIDSTIKDHIVEIQNHIGSSDAKIAWVAKKNLHITLKYLGEVKDTKKIQEALKRIKNKKITAHLIQFDTFPKQEPRVLYIAVEPEKELRNLAQAVDAETIEISEDKPFVAHITIGRVKQIKFLEEFKRKQKTLQIRPLHFRIDRFQLMTSKLTTAGAEYKVVEEYHLE